MPKTKTENSKPIDFFKGKEISYKTKNNSLDIELKLKIGQRGGWKRGVDYEYSFNLTFTYQCGQKSTASWTYDSFNLSDRGHFEGLFKDITNKADIFSSVLNLSETSGSDVSRDDITKCLFDIEEQIDKDFFIETGAWTRFKPGLFKKYFKPYEPESCDD